MTSQCAVGAYLLVKPGPMLGPGDLTASACLADMAPDCWAIEWVSTREEEREERADRLGIRRDDLPAVVQWATDHFDEGGFAWPNVFCTRDTANQFRRQFSPQGVHLLGIGLPLDLVDAFLGLTAPPRQQPGYAPVGPIGVYDVLRERQPLALGGAGRGYEVLGIDEAGQFNSFRCNQLEDDFRRLFGATFNAWGLIDDEAMARACAEYASGPEVGTCARAWHPWLVEEYPS